MKQVTFYLVAILVGLTLSLSFNQAHLRKDLDKQYSQSNSNLFQTRQLLTNVFIQQQHIINNHAQALQVLWTNNFPVINPLTNNSIGGKEPRVIYK